MMAFSIMKTPSPKVNPQSMGGAKVLCILHHRGVQLILAYSWARPAILVVGKGRGGMFLFLLFLHFHSCSSFFPVPLFHLLYSLLSLFSLSLGDDTKWPSRVDVSLNPNTITINQSIRQKCLCFVSGLVKTDKMSVLNPVSQVFDHLSLKLKIYENIFISLKVKTF